MDRFWGLKCGLPVQVNDSDIQVDLPAHLLDDREREQLPDPALQIASISVARLAGHISQELYGPGKPAGCFLQHEQSLLAQSRRWLESLPDSLKLKPAGDNSRDVTVLHLQFHYCVILAIRPALLHALPHKAGSIPDSAVDTMPANMMAILETCGHTAKHSISLCIYAWTKGFIGMLSYDFPAFLFSAVLALLVTGHIRGVKVGEIPEVETAREILKIHENSGNIASKAFNLHLQSVIKSFEDHGRTAAAADKVPRSAVDKVASESSIQSLAPEFDMAVESFSWLMSAETMTTEMAFDHTNMQQFLANDELAVTPQDTINRSNDPMSPFWWLDQPLYTE
ncbi:fungal specific transcription factor [Beauveria brongniartii RCEF 3172]|uniref:Fungal specific transcription factor n=1 Tax=Beauveria brongniartii RCEF 3172 TaxID=1081107 RepID=A0A167L800_9HYPO|nr:fungal specific transcription factor [Beauveria brongniartii RCEF 3172]